MQNSRLIGAPVSAQSSSAMAARAETQRIFGQVMGLVTVTLGFTALGAYIGRDLSGGWGIAAFVVGLVLLLGLNAALRRSQTLAMTMLFGVGLLLGLVLGPVLAEYVSVNPAVVWQAAGSTALFVAALGSYGWGTRRELAPAARVALWALLALIVFAIVAIFVSIPGANVIWSVAGLVIFSAFTAYDFQRLRTAGEADAIPIAASIFLDILNVFQFFLLLFGGGSDD